MLCFDVDTSITLGDNQAFWELMRSIAFILEWKDGKETLLIAIRNLRSIQQKKEEEKI